MTNKKIFTCSARRYMKWVMKEWQRSYGKERQGGALFHVAMNAANNAAFNKLRERGWIVPLDSVLYWVGYAKSSKIPNKTFSKLGTKALKQNKVVDIRELAQAFANKKDLRTVKFKRV